MSNDDSLVLIYLIDIYFHFLTNFVQGKDFLNKIIF